MNEIKSEGLYEGIPENKIPDNQLEDSYESTLVNNFKDYSYLDKEEREKKAIGMVDELLEEVSSSLANLKTAGLNPYHANLYFLAGIWKNRKVEDIRKGLTEIISELQVNYRTGNINKSKARQAIIERNLPAQEIFDQFEKTKENIRRAFIECKDTMEKVEEKKEIKKIRTSTADLGAVQKIRNFLSGK